MDIKINGQKVKEDAVIQDNKENKQMTKFDAMLRTQQRGSRGIISSAPFGFNR